jgi:hypothetical protein
MQDAGWVVTVTDVQSSVECVTPSKEKDLGEGAGVSC